MVNHKKRVLFICKNNAGRSQMAEGLLKHLYGDKYDVYSAGFDPKEISPLSIQVLAEIGADISNQYSKSIKEYEGQDFDYIFTLCDDSCPLFLDGKKCIHHEFRDPKKHSEGKLNKIDVFRSIRDEIKDWIEKTFAE